MNGTTAYVAPFDIFTNRPNRMSSGMASDERRGLREDSSATPSQNSATNSHFTRPRKSPAIAALVAEPAAQRAGEDIHHAEHATRASRPVLQRLAVVQLLEVVEVVEK